jgi:hypothetical protein
MRLRGQEKNRYCENCKKRRERREKNSAILREKVRIENKNPDLLFTKNLFKK